MRQGTERHPDTSRSRFSGRLRLAALSVAVMALAVLMQVGVLFAAGPPLSFVEVIKDDGAGGSIEG